MAAAAKKAEGQEERRLVARIGSGRGDLKAKEAEVQAERDEEDRKLLKLPDDERLRAQARLAFSRFDARQMVAHGHVHVNGRRLDIPSYLVRAGDDISVVGKEKLTKKASDAIEMNKGRPLPTWLEATPADNKGRVIQLPKREDVSVELNEQLIVELCSK